MINMASNGTKVKKAVFFAGKAAAVGLLCCGLFWLVVGIAVFICLGGWKWAKIAAIVSIIAGVAFLAGAFFSWKKFTELGKENAVIEQKENQLEYERDFSMVICPDCNGKNKVRKGTVAECIYCGNHIQG